MKKKGIRLKGIRLDSGDLSYLSKKARKMLDLAGLDYVQIIASNQLDEYIITSLLEQGAPIDGFGVGTALATGKGAGALDGVYKLSMIDEQPTSKISENPTKTTLPGKKTVYRILDQNGSFKADAIVLESEQSVPLIMHPFEQGKGIEVETCKKESLTSLVMEQGMITGKTPDLHTISAYAQERLDHLPEEHKRFVFPHTYKVGISPALVKLRDDHAKQD
jgi:nicotinate phosphoribosyltransferase